MRRSLRRVSRSVCLLLVCVSLALHLLLAVVSLSVLQLTCEPSPPHHLRALGRSVNASLVSSVKAATPSTAAEKLHGRTATNGGLKKTDMSQVVRTRGYEASHQGNKPMAFLSWTGQTNQQIPSDKTSGMGQSKLRTLFEHPLYNLPQAALQQDDWLLRVKAKVKDNIESSLEWVSTSHEGYDDIQWNDKVETQPPWLRFHLAITRWQLYDRNDPNLLALLEQMATHRIVSAVQKPGGTQLKLVMSFPNYGQVLFKPMKQERDEETNPNLFYFSDFERHNAEIAAFHLDRVLGFQRVPPVVGRLINVTKEIKHITTDHQLVSTFYISPAGNVCFYGQCSYYCSPEHGLCGRPHAMEASLAVMLPDLSLAPRRSWRSPWRRSYSRSKLAQWEKDQKYCNTVKKTPPYNKGTRLVDVIDMAILDFLMNNMDRHHYETFEKFGNDTFLLHLDNGRAFGRHSRDELSILAPLRQCCRLRRSTFLRLHLLSQPQFRLSDVMRESLSQDPLTSVAALLSEPHLAALDRRLTTVLRLVQQCREQHPAKGEVIFDDVGTHAGTDITAWLFH